ncbi:MAG: glycosyltransferase family A protein [Nitrospiria bacterium]
MAPNPFTDQPLLFSIITPCYGKDWKFLEPCIKATIDSDYQNFEIIVVFDGPNKRGAVVMERLIHENPDHNIRYFVIPHGGAPVARNYGATKAKGDIYSFLDADSCLYPETLRHWANAFEEHPEINRVWGIKDIQIPQGVFGLGGNVPVDPTGRPLYWSFRTSNFCDAAQPMRASIFPGFDPILKSLQDWDLNLTMLEKDNYEGRDWLYIPKSFYLTNDVRPGGISSDSHKNWLERTAFIRAKHNIPLSDICVVSHGAPHHGVMVSKMLGADYNPMPSFKPNNYKLIYLLGFYTAAPTATGKHMEVFAENGHVKYLENDLLEVLQYSKARKVIHWIGTDILNLYWNCSFEKLKAIRQWIKDEKVINLVEFEPTKKELTEIGIEASIVPIPPQRLYSPLPCPSDFSVGIYENEHSKMYKEALMERVTQSMPDVKFYFFGDQSKKGQTTENTEHLGFIDMATWLPKLSCCLRVTVHDGLPLGAVEFLMAGRNVVTNVNIKGAIKIKADRKSIIEGIRHAQDNPLNVRVGQYWRRTLNQEKYKKRIWNLIGKN